MKTKWRLVDAEKETPIFLICLFSSSNFIAIYSLNEFIGYLILLFI